MIAEGNRNLCEIEEEQEKKAENVSQIYAKL
jgi:hypothetical protein